jgi:hypothetical protein
MSDKKTEALQLSQALEFHPRWWWDPAPPWLLQELSREAIREIGIVQLELQKTVLEAQVQAATRVLAAVGRSKVG